MTTAGVWPEEGVLSPGMVNWGQRIAIVAADTTTVLYTPTTGRTYWVRVVNINNRSSGGAKAEFRWGTNPGGVFTEQFVPKEVLAGFDRSIGIDEIKRQTLSVPLVCQINFPGGNPVTVDVVVEVEVLEFAGANG